MHRAALMLYLAILATPASADECNTLRDALAILKAAEQISDTISDLDMDFLPETGHLAAFTSESLVRNDADEAAAAVVAAHNAELSTQHQFLIREIMNMRDAARHKVKEFFDAGGDVSYTVRANDILDDVGDGYYALILAIACR